MDPTLLDTLRAAMDRIIPEDDYPSASDVGVVDYIARLLAVEGPPLAVEMAAGLEALDAEARLAGGLPLAALSTQAQDALLARIERGQIQAHWAVEPERFFALLVRLANEGYYGDPRSGGNRDRIGWRMIGFAMDDRR